MRCAAAEARGSRGRGGRREERRGKPKATTCNETDEGAQRSPGLRGRTRVRLCPKNWRQGEGEGTHLVEPDGCGLLAEALTAEVKAVFSDETRLVGAEATVFCVEIK